MISLFTGTACSAECDLRRASTPPPARPWSPVLLKVPPDQRARLEEDCLAMEGRWYIWRHHLGTWHATSSMKPSQKHGADVIIAVWDDGKPRILKARFGPLHLASILNA